MLIPDGSAPSFHAAGHAVWVEIEIETRFILDPFRLAHPVQLQPKSSCHTIKRG